MDMAVDFMPTDSESAPKKCPEDTLAIAHDDDLQLVENVVRPRPMFGATNNMRV